MGKNRLNDKMFEILVHEHHRRLLAYALSLVRRNDLAEDLVQNALLAAYRKIARFDPTRDFGNWVRGMVRMEYLKWARKERVVPVDRHLLEALDHRHQQWQTAVRDERREPLEALEACLQRLRERCGLVVGEQLAGKGEAECLAPADSDRWQRVCLIAQTETVLCVVILQRRVLLVAQEIQITRHRAA